MSVKDYEDNIYQENDRYEDEFDETQEETFGEKRQGRTRGDRRKKNARKAKRKKRIADAIYDNEEGYYDNLHQYSKNKIHCSCPMCSGVYKTDSKKANKGGAAHDAQGKAHSSRFGTTNHRKGKNYKHSEVRKIEMMNAKELEREF